MKKILSLFIILSFIICGAGEQQLIQKITQQTDNIDKVNLVDKGAEKASDEVSDFVKEQNKTKVKVDDFQNSDVKNQIKVENKDVLNSEGVKALDKAESIYKKYYSEILKKDESAKLFGIDIINNSNNLIMPLSITKEYVLANGDKVTIKVWTDIFTGTTEDASQALPMEISKQGTVFVPNIGSFFASGKSISNLQNEIVNEGRKKIKSFNAEVTLEKIRDISIFVVGEVKLPGQILTNPYSNIFNILNKANGVTDKASLRNIKIIRGNDEIDIDLYGYLLGNKNIDELKLKDGDTLYVPVAKDLVVIEGEVNKPAIYELGNEKDYRSLISIAGGFGKLANQNLVQGYFVNNGSISIQSLNLGDKINGNIVKLSVNKINDKNRNDIYLLGAVVNPGVYSYEKGIKFAELMKKAGGFIKESTSDFATIIRGNEQKTIINFNPNRENPSLELGDEVYIYNYTDINNKAYANVQGAVVNVGNYEIYDGSRILNILYSARGLDESLNPYMNRADLYRVDENGRLKVFKIDLNKLLEGDSNENILIRRNDILKIYTYDEIVKYDDIYIYGEVREPGKYRYYENMSLEDIVFYAKGLKNKAENNIIVVRNDAINKKSIEHNVDIERNPDFKILEGDLIFVRKKSDWQDTKIIKLDGFVKYPGTYYLNDGETLNSLVKRAGGFANGAFPEGIQFNRVLEKAKEVDGKTIEAQSQKITNFDFDNKSFSFVRDIELIDGDTIYIPEKPTTVRVDGEVYAPSYVVYDKSMDNYKDYISAAGGYKESAYTSKVFVIKANGKSISKPGSTKIEPGDTVYVPKDLRAKKGLDRGIELFKGTLEIVSTIALIVLLF